MKKVLLALSLVASLTAVSAFAAGDEPQIIAECQSADTGDLGYHVTLSTGGYAGVTMAEVTESTIAGERLLGTAVVNEKIHGMQKAFRGVVFNLTINLESMAPTKEHPAHLNAHMDGEDIDAELTCTLE